MQNRENLLVIAQHDVGTAAGALLMRLNSSSSASVSEFVMVTSMFAGLPPPAPALSVGRCSVESRILPGSSDFAPCRRTEWFPGQQQHADTAPGRPGSPSTNAFASKAEAAVSAGGAARVPPDAAVAGASLDCSTLFIEAGCSLARKREGPFNDGFEHRDRQTTRLRVVATAMIGIQQHPSSVRSCSAPCANR